jgi:hypothetical protein
MFKDNTNQDVESTDHERRSELDPLIQRDVKVPTKQEAHVARAQFFAICWSMFVTGWINGSTGPLLPRIQIFYNASWPLCYSFDYFFNVSILQVGFGTASWVFVLQRTVSDIKWGS